MKKYIILLLFLPIICFSQNINTPSPVKPSTTDCPDWSDKSKPKNKADYYRSLRSKKQINGGDSSKTNYSYNKPKAATKKVTAPKTPVKTTEVKKDTAHLAKTETKEKEEKEKKTKRLPPRKTTKARKKKTTGCPQF